MTIDVTFNRKALIKTLEQALPTVAKTVANPAYQNIQLRTSLDDTEPRCSIIASDGETTQVSQLDSNDVNVNMAGSVLLPPLIVKLLKTVEDDEVRVYADDADLIVHARNQTGRPSWRLGVEAGHIDFPQLGEYAISTHTLDTSSLLSAFKIVIPAIAGEFTSPQLRYIQIVTRDEHTVVRAYGGNQYRCTNLNNFTGDINVLIPLGFAKHIVRLVDPGVDPTIALAVYEKMLSLGTQTQLHTDKARTMYPDLDKYVLEPKQDGVQELVVDREEFVTALSRVKPLSGDLNYVEVELRNGVINLTAIDQLGREARDVVQSQWNDVPVRFGADIDQLTSMLRAVPMSDSLDIAIGFSKGARPGLVYFDGAEYTGHMEQLRYDLLRSR